jgi:hypothetical protein
VIATYRPANTCGIFGEEFMHAVVRNYSGKGAKELFNIFEKNKAEIEGLVRSIRGFVGYSLVRTAEGWFSVSVYEDITGTDESIRVIRDWRAKNASNTHAREPSVSEGLVTLHLK